MYRRISSVRDGFAEVLEPHAYSRLYVAERGKAAEMLTLLDRQLQRLTDKVLSWLITVSELARPSAAEGTYIRPCIQH